MSACLLACLLFVVSAWYQAYSSPFIPPMLNKLTLTALPWIWQRVMGGRLYFSASWSTLMTSSFLILGKLWQFQLFQSLNAAHNLRRSGMAKKNRSWFWNHDVFKLWDALKPVNGPWQMGTVSPHLAHINSPQFFKSCTLMFCHLKTPGLHPRRTIMESLHEKRHAGREGVRSDSR